MNSYVFYRDGKRIYGELVLPEEKRESYPTVIYCHGFGSSLVEGAGYAEEFARNGVATFLFDFIGGGRNSRSDGTMLEMTVLTEAEDLKKVIESVVDIPEIDTGRLFLMGSSQGGYITSIVAPDVSEKIRGVVNLYPGFVIPDDARKRMEAPGYDRNDISVMGFEIGHIYNVVATSFDGYEKAAGYKGPMLIIHGTADSIVPIDYSEKAMEIYENARIIRIPGAGHGFSGNDFSTAADAAVRFVKSHM